MPPESQDFQIVHASLEDVDAIVALEQAASPVPWSKASMTAELSGHAFSRMFVARYRGGDANRGTSTICGYICLWVVFEELRIMNVVTAADYRRRGLAGALVELALRVGRDEGALRGFLEVRKGNIAAQHLYRKHGFQTYGHRTNYYTNPCEDAMLMVRDPLTPGV